MQQLSVVIICKNEAHIIDKVLESLFGLTDNIIIYDNGSTDSTIEKVKSYPVRLERGDWEGFGKTKNKAIGLAKYDWILSLDADESIDEELKRALLDLTLDDEKTVYDLRFRNFLGKKPLHYGEWGKDHHIRLFNRKHVLWNDAPVHEELIIPPGFNIKKLNGLVLHFSMRDMNDYTLKMARYAMLNAEKYFGQGKKASWYRLKLSPGFTFIHNYIFRFGFLDGQAGFIAAKMTAWYTFLKYSRLKELWIKKEDKSVN